MVQVLCKAGLDAEPWKHHDLRRQLPARSHPRRSLPPRPATLVRDCFIRQASSIRPAVSCWRVSQRNFAAGNQGDRAPGERHGIRVNPARAVAQRRSRVHPVGQAIQRLGRQRVKVRRTSEVSFPAIRRHEDLGGGPSRAVHRRVRKARARPCDPSLLASSTSPPFMGQIGRPAVPRSGFCSRRFAIGVGQCRSISVRFPPLGPGPRAGARGRPARPPRGWQG